MGVMIIPQGMAYGMLAGLPPIYGLYASLVPLAIYALLATSKHMMIGPAAMISLLVAAGASQVADPETQTYINIVISMALVVGVLQFLIASVKLGSLVNFISQPVISGFTTAAAFLIFASQLRHLTGIDLPRSPLIHNTVGGLIENAGQINWITFAIGVGGILVMYILKRINRKIPGALVAVIIGICLVYFAKFNTQGVSIVGEVPKGLPSFTIPQLDFAVLKRLSPDIISLTLIAIIQSLIVAKALQARHKNYEIDPTQELRALSFSNIVGSFFLSSPTGGSFTRSAVNEQAGAETGMSSIFSVLVVGLTLLFLTPLFFYLPNAILSSIIILAVTSFIDIKEAKYLWKTDRIDFLMMAITFFVSLLFGIDIGVLAGLVLSLLMVVVQSSKPHFAELGKIKGSKIYRNVNRFPELEQRDDILIFRFDAHLYFANSAYFKEKVRTLASKKGDELKLIILNCESISRIDSSAIHLLKDLILEYREVGIEVYLTGVIGPVRDKMKRGGLSEFIGQDHFFLRVHDAVKFYHGSGEYIHKKYTTPSSGN